jgi:alcohol dehydrogenase class IV
VEALSKRFGLPTTFSGLGIDRSRFRAIAEKTMSDPGVGLNPRPITRPEDIVEILEIAV